VPDIACSHLHRLCFDLGVNGDPPDVHCPRCFLQFSADSAICVKCSLPWHECPGPARCTGPLPRFLTWCSKQSRRAEIRQDALPMSDKGFLKGVTCSVCLDSARPMLYVCAWCNRDVTLCLCEFPPPVGHLSSPRDDVRRYHFHCPNPLCARGQRTLHEHSVLSKWCGTKVRIHLITCSLCGLCSKDRLCLHTIPSFLASSKHLWYPCES